MYNPLLYKVSIDVKYPLFYRSFIKECFHLNDKDILYISREPFSSKQRLLNKYFIHLFKPINRTNSHISPTNKIIIMDNNLTSTLIRNITLLFF